MNACLAKCHFSVSEVTNKAGDLVVVLDRSDKDRLKGVVHEKEVFFPCNILNEIPNASASSLHPLSDEATAKETFESVIADQSTTASRAAEALTLFELAEGKDNRGQGTTASHATEEPKLLEHAEGWNNPDQVTTASGATEEPMLPKLAEERVGVAMEVSSASSHKTGNISDLAVHLTATEYDG